MDARQASGYYWDGRIKGAGRRRWRNVYAGLWALELAERVPGNEDAGTGVEQGIREDPVFRSIRAHESRRLRRTRRWPRWNIK